MEDHKAQRRKTAFYIKRISGLILLLATAAVFLFSGITKLYAFESFIWNIMDAGVRNMTLAAVLARLFVGFELILGLFLLAHLYLRSFTFPAVITMLLLFTGYLVLLIIRQGDGGNCGCFGDTWEMKPSLAIVKNLVMTGVVLALYRLYPVKLYRQSGWIAGLLGMTGLILPFLVIPMSGDARPEVTSRPIDLFPLYRTQGSPNKPLDTDLRKGKHIVAFMSLSCPHCRKAAFLLQVVHRQHPDLPVFMVLNGHPDLLDEFFRETHAQDVPYTLFRGADEFRYMAGSGVPAIYYISNGVVEREANYFQLDPAYMYEWLREDEQ